MGFYVDVKKSVYGYLGMPALQKKSSIKQKS
jgi:hypothetical protein